MGALVRFRSGAVMAGLSALSAALSGCGDAKDEAALATLDAQIGNSVSDPALREAVEAPLASDPDLAGEANRDAIRPADRPLNGAVPANLSPAQAREGALKLAGGKLLPAPPVTKSAISVGAPVTLGGMAAQMLDKTDSKTCRNQPVSYDMGWAARMPAALPVYPGGAVMEAAGAYDSGVCAVRAVSFAVAGTQGEVMDFYTTMVRRAGYSVEHIEHNGEQVLSGGKQGGDFAYTIHFRAMRGGGANISIIANDGR